VAELLLSLEWMQQFIYYLESRLVSHARSQIDIIYVYIQRTHRAHVSHDSNPQGSVY
jgi:hypothetical protein